MSFQCPVCEQTFKRVQDRSAHIRLKRDLQHQQFLLEQRQALMRQFSDTVEAATSIAATASSRHQPVLEIPTVQTNDVDQDDLPSSRSMDIDDDEYSNDDEVGLESEPERLIRDEDEEDEDDMKKAMEEAARAIDFEDILEVFNFLPNPDLEDAAERDAGPGPSTSSYPHMRRTLVDDNAQSHTYQWHPSAGQVFKYEETVHSRWQSLFAADHSSNPEYKPFHSRLDWEIAQWAVKEKIPQKSFDRLLRIPKVGFDSAKHQMLLMKMQYQG
jgi:hypothetical protein